MINKRFYDHERLTEKKAKESSNKKKFTYPYKSQRRSYDLGDFFGDAGNLEIAKFFESVFVQAKLNISQSGDINEQEADRIAKDIVNSSTTQLPEVNHVIFPQ